jgi:hypothetical protein
MRCLRSISPLWLAFAVCGACRATRDTSRDSAAPTANAADNGASNAVAAIPETARSAPEWAGTHELATHVGSYALRWRSTPEMLPLAQNFALDVWVFAASAPDVPLTDVTLDVDAGMPQHGHGLARRPRIARVGPGHWRAEGLRFHMPGRWELFFDVTRGARLERAQTSVVLE